VQRRSVLILEHFSAQIEEIDDMSLAARLAPPGRYVVDSWFFNNGQPAAVMPLANWQAGESPNGSE
jgi:hypothetical protein